MIFPWVFVNLLKKELFQISPPQLYTNNWFSWAHLGYMKTGNPGGSHGASPPVTALQSASFELRNHQVEW